MVERILSSVCRIFLFSAVAFPFLRIAGRLEYCYLYILWTQQRKLFAFKSMKCAEKFENVSKEKTCSVNNLLCFSISPEKYFLAVTFYFTMLLREGQTNLLTLFVFVEQLRSCANFKHTHNCSYILW